MKHGSKKEFVLAQGSDLSAADVVRLGKAQGITLSNAYVYVIRSQNKISGRKEKVSTGLKRGPKPKASRASSAFIESALEIGYARAKEILATLRKRAAL